MPNLYIMEKSDEVLDLEISYPEVNEYLDLNKTSDMVPGKMLIFMYIYPSIYSI
jgi:hypothetical protein